MGILRQWSDRMRPHLVVGGDHDGRVVRYNGVVCPKRGFEYSIPGLLTFMPLYLKADEMRPISADEANRVESARDQARTDRRA